MIWIWWIILTVICLILRRLCPTAGPLAFGWGVGRWYAYDFRTPWDPRDGHPEWGKWAQEIPDGELGPNPEYFDKLNRGVVLPAVSSNWQKHRRREP